MMAPRKTALTNIEAVTLVVADLGGLDAPVHLERISAGAFHLLPGAFRWDLDEFDEYIDKDKVRVSLTDAVKKGYVTAAGVTKRGTSKKTDLWRLTSAGSEATERFRDWAGSAPPRVKRGTANVLRKRLESSALFEKFGQGGTVDYSPYELTDLLECSPDADDRIIRERFEALRGHVARLQDPVLSKFIDLCARAHSRILGGDE